MSEVAVTAEAATPAPCRFCASVDIGWTDPDCVQCVCRCCFARGPISQCATGAIYSWNTHTAPKVKPLEWVENEDGDWLSSNQLIQCGILGPEDGVGVWSFGVDGQLLSDHETLDAAKAEAQAYYNALEATQ